MHDGVFELVHDTDVHDDTFAGATKLTCIHEADVHHGA